MIKKSFVFLSQIINEQTIDSFNQSLKNLKIKKIVLCSFIILPSQNVEYLFYEWYYYKISMTTIKQKWKFGSS